MENLITKIELKLQELGIIKKETKVETKLEEDAVTGETETTEVKTEIVVLPEGVVLPEIGEAVYIPVEDGEDTIVEDGEYELADKTVIVIAEGKLTEIKPVVVEEVVEEEVVEEEVKLAGVEKNRISEIIDLTKNGCYTIELDVYDGEITWGSLYTSTWENLVMAEETKATKAVDELTLAFETKLSDEAKKYEDIIEALKVGETTRLENEVPVKLSQIEVRKLQLAEKRKNK